jgi:Right handed beta helix region/RTX calcium-binding nonapeptide repeat (4 copies)
MPTVTLRGDYGYTPYKVSDLAANSIIDATTASWTLANSRNSNPTASISYDSGSLPISRYPFLVYDAGPGLTIKGGTINGQVPQQSDWEYTYANSAGLRVEGSPNAIIDDWTISKPWDGIRIAAGTSNFTIEDTWISNARDDAIENDDLETGTIRDSLLENVFSGISLGDGDKVDGSDNVITFDGVLMRSKAYLYKGEMTHGSPIKMESSSLPGTLAPSLRFIDTVIAIEKVDHEGQGRLEKAWDKTIESRGNVFLNLSDTPLPSDYPKPGAGWTILQGKAARDYWEKARAEWIAEHGGTTTNPAPTNPPPTNPAPSINKILGTSNADVLTGKSGIDEIYGYGNNDRLYGKEGKDILNGGAGKDIFVFDTKTGSTNVDKIVDFNVADDSIYLDNAIFSKLGSGSLSSPRKLDRSYFEAKAAADDSNDYILYNKATGSLSYDADGSRSGKAVEIAKLAAGLNLTYNDFYVI